MGGLPVRCYIFNQINPKLLNFLKNLCFHKSCKLFYLKNLRFYLKKNLQVKLKLKTLSQALSSYAHF
jgi:hypothetical protein